KAAKDEVDRQRKMANGLEDEVQKLRTYSNQTFAGHHELDRLRVESNATCVVKGQLGRQVGNLRGILERTERDLVTLRSQRGPSNETWMEELWRKGNGRYNFTGTDLGRGVHGVVEHAIDALNRRDDAIKITRCQPSGRPYNSAAREVVFMANQRSLNVMSLLASSTWNPVDGTTPSYGSSWTTYPPTCGLSSMTTIEGRRLGPSSTT
ncbi:unnamed protein product, partial [Tilletia controversa]